MESNSPERLETMVAAAVASHIFMHPEIDAMLQIEETIFPIDLRQEYWSSIERKFMEITGNLLPIPLRNMVFGFLKPLHETYDLWKKDHYLNKKIKQNVYKSCISWEIDSATINRRKTAAKLIRNRRVDVRTRFIMACTYYQEDDIVDLWRQIRGKTRRAITRRGSNDSVRFWVKLLKKKATHTWREEVENHYRVTNSKPYDSPLILNCFFRYLNQGKQLQMLIKQFATQRLHLEDFLLCMNHMDDYQRANVRGRIPVFFFELLADPGIMRDEA
ncbi:uncharacterized protein LOC129961047 [Argiope bruennichi]|uniref:Uncharacterized protein n=1 Tax=Argiope bruennichi TaxID=94029 RepID=A0A8T0FJ98_ARGBR|nr:uncharacterized protein LOC129961047 [Argiope bruennichi]KAF8790465.1 hypothetical protein HNY73_005483 [Argiope bruennichi]